MKNKIPLTSDLPSAYDTSQIKRPSRILRDVVPEKRPIADAIVRAERELARRHRATAAKTAAPQWLMAPMPGHKRPSSLHEAKKQRQDAEHFNSIIAAMTENDFFRSTECSAHTLCTRLGFSAFNFTNIIARETNGATFPALIGVMRMMRAAAILSKQSPRRHVTDETLAFRVGYTSRQTLLRNFQAVFGVSPTAYAQKQ